MDWTARGSLEEDRRKGPFTSDKSSISNLLKEEHDLSFPDVSLAFFPGQFGGRPNTWVKRKNCVN